MTYVPHADPAAVKARDLAIWDRVAKSLLEAGGVAAPPVPTNLVAFFDPGRRVTIARSQLERGHSGQIVRDELGWVIHVREGDHPLAQRFAVFHEGFHLLRRVRGIEVEDDWHYREWLANRFARQILMPRAWLFEALTKTTDLWRLCKIFAVSRPRMQERLRELGR